MPLPACSSTCLLPYFLLKSLLMFSNELDYTLPPELIAQKPVEPRDHSRLLVVDRSTDGLADRHFYDLPEFLSPGDCLVINDTKVIPARLFFHKPTGGKVEGLFLRELQSGLWDVMFKGMAKLKSGTKLILEGCDDTFTLGQKSSPKSFELHIDSNVKVPAVQLLERFGQMPLPPYIRGGKENPLDRTCYQTVFGQIPGAVAAPTAGLHFTPELLEKIKTRDVKVVTVTLHVGMGTFEPLTAEDLADHKIHQEWFTLTPTAADTLNDAKDQGKKVVAVGTTSVRVLETAADQNHLVAQQGWTDIFIYPPYRFKFVDRLVTNFHLPKTTLLALVCAFAGQPQTLNAYHHAIRQKYRFYSYGDAMLIV
jgi:S-adenosylmethionine:tRNA ribosyltransferase-isomerase